MFDVNSIRMPNDFVLRNGVKMLIYGIPGSGKTRFATTATRPLIWAIEHGLLSVRSENIPTVMLPIQDEINSVLAEWSGNGMPKRDPFQCVNEFVDWITNPLNGKEYQVLFVDSLSELCSLVFQFYDAVNKNGLKAYGDTADRMMIWVKKLYYCNKDIVFVCKERTVNIGTIDNPVNVIEPAFDGQKTKVEVTHLLDVILRFKKHTFKTQGKGTTYDVAHTKGDSMSLARDKTGLLAEFEPQHYDTIRSKLLGLNK